ncbi:hypothetical protein Leryth_006831 [Lithospermum erythrorhizon]|nr:hypothetical protein Leryth_006831 [Lithospermum erythrorhizon]
MNKSSNGSSLKTWKLILAAFLCELHNYCTIAADCDCKMLKDTPFSANATGPSTLNHVDQGGSTRVGPSTLNNVAQGGYPIIVSNAETQDGTYGRAEMAVVCSKKLESDLQAMGQRVKQHEENLKFLKGEVNKLDESIVGKEAVLEKFHATNAAVQENEDHPRGRSEDEIMEQIVEQESAAALFYLLPAQHGIQVSDDSYLPAIRDVVGVVATLCKVDDDNLCCLLAEYLGPEFMLALVCKTIDGVKALETYDREGLIDKSVGIHGLAASTGRHLNGRNTVICLEILQPYAGGFITDDPERRLDIRKPRLPNGETPPGFLGFAVNLISLDSANLFCVTSSGHGLRETLFYHLFSSLQVYGSRKDMFEALPCINNGAISVDGGIIKRKALFYMGVRESVDVKFPRSSKKLNVPDNYFETEKEIKEMKWRKERVVDDITREQELLNRTKLIFNEKKEDLVKFLHQSATFLAQKPTQAQH